MPPADSPAPPPVLLATDGPERFARVGSRFLDEPVRVEDVRIVDLGPPQAETGAGSGPA